MWELRWLMSHTWAPLLCPFYSVLCLSTEGMSFLTNVCPVRKKTEATLSQDSPSAAAKFLALLARAPCGPHGLLGTDASRELQDHVRRATAFEDHGAGGISLRGGKGPVRTTLIPVSDSRPALLIFL